MAKALALTNKTAIMSSRFTGSKMRSADTEGDEGGDAGDYQPGRKLRFTEIKVGEPFASELAQHPGVFKFLFDYGPNNKPKAEASERCKEVRITEKFKGCKVTIAWGIESKLEVLNARVSAIRLKADGAECKMQLDLQGLFPMSMETLELESKSGEEVRLSIRFGAVDAEDEEAAAELGEQADFVDEQNDDQAEEAPAPVDGGVPAMGAVH